MENTATNLMLQIEAKVKQWRLVSTYGPRQALREIEHLIIDSQRQEWKDSHNG